MDVVGKVFSMQVFIDHKFDGKYQKYTFREPVFVGMVRTKIEDLDGMQQFGVIGLHTRPYRAYSEISGLTLVMQGVRELFEVEDMLIMGDLNAGKSFFGKTDLALSFLPEEVDAENPANKYSQISLADCKKYSDNCKKI